VTIHHNNGKQQWLKHLDGEENIKKSTQPVEKFEIAAQLW